MHRSLVIPWVCLVFFIRSSSSRSYWYGDQYWNERYRSKGIDYSTDDRKYGLWSDNPAALEGNYLWSKATYEGIACSGCTCNDANRHVTCSGSSVSIKAKIFTNVTSTTFPSSVSSVQIIKCASFESLINDPFSHRSSLTTLTIQKTLLRDFPNLNGTSSLQKLNLVENSIQFFSENYTDIPLPSTLTHVALMHNNIRWLPENLFAGSNIQILSLSDNKISYLVFQAFRNMGQLKYLGLDGNQMTEVSKDLINTLATSPVQHLNFSNNEIQFLPMFGFLVLTNLKILELHGNKIQTLEPNVFASLPSILHIDLNSNKMEQMMTERPFSNISSLVALWLQNQNPKMTSFSYLTMEGVGAELEYFSLGQNALTSFPHATMMRNSFPKIKQIWVDFNKIDNLTKLGFEQFGVASGPLYDQDLALYKPFSTLGALGHLHAASNLIVGINDTELSLLESLNYLDVSSNQITETSLKPLAFFNNTRLASLIIKFNKIQYVPDAVRVQANAQSLTTLSMNGNKLTFISRSTFTNMSSLRTVNLDSNSIITVEDESFHTDIIAITLGSNLFRFLNVNPFSNLNNLTTLNLGSNKIDELPLVALENCTSLNNLDLSGNQIGYILKQHLQACPLGGITTFANNEIAYIEDGTFAHVTSASALSLANNRLTSLPHAGDFTNLTLSINLDLSGNRITAVKAGQFHTVSAMNLDLSNNQISKIHAGAFHGVSISQSLDLSTNPLGDIEANGFNVVSCGKNLYLPSSTYLTRLRSFAFNNVTVTKTFRITSCSNLATIEDRVFNGVATESLELNSNSINSVGQMFGASPTNSRVTKLLNMQNNQLTFIPNNMLLESTITEINLQSNKLQEFPPSAFQGQPFATLDMRNNLMTEVAPSGIGGLRQLTELDLSSNSIEQLQPKTFENSTSLEKITIDSNANLTRLAEGLFSSLSSLTLISITNSPLVHFPMSTGMTALQTVTLTGNSKLETIDRTVFNQSTALATISLGNAPLSCSCETYYAFFRAPPKATVTGASCTEPASLAGTTFNTASKKDGTYYTNHKSSFKCAPQSVTATAADGPEITVSWNKPSEVYPENTADPAAPWTYTVTCADMLSSDTATATRSVSNLATTSLSKTLRASNGLKAGRYYRCYVTVTSGGTSSGKSNPAFVNSREAVFSQGAAGANDITLKAKYFDFSVTNTDFTLSPSVTSASIDNVNVRFSPYGTYLYRTDQSPVTDPFTTWWRPVAGVNQEFSRTLIVPHASSSPNINKLWLDAAYYPVDGIGYRTEAQRDCGVTEHNFGFTGNFDTAFKFQGKEVITIGAGNEMWLAVNGYLLANMSESPRTNAHSCVSVNIANATAAGGSFVKRWTGSIVSGSCVLNTSTEETLTTSLKLETDEIYRFNIFYVNRKPCSASIYLELQDMLVETNTAPYDAIVDLREDVDQATIVKSFNYTDVFSTGPNYQLSFTGGNTGGNFEFAEYSTSRTSPSLPPPFGTNTTLNGISKAFFTCSPGPSVTTPSMPATSVSYSASAATVITRRAFDFDASSQRYTVSINISDVAASRIGSYVIAVRILDVNDHCPTLVESSFSQQLIPALQEARIFQLQASDVDSGDNGLISYYVSAYQLDSGFNIFNKTLDIHKQVYPDNTTVTFNIVAMDNGDPPRGAIANVSLRLSNTCILNVVFQEITREVIVNATTGDVFFRIPKYRITQYNCSFPCGMQSGIILNDRLSASSAETKSPANRARLHLQTEALQGLTGGWVAATSDGNQWYQVSLLQMHKFRGIQMQGQYETDNYIETFSIQYRTSSSGAWTTYSNNAGTSVFTANTDNTNVVAIDFVPFFLALELRILPQTWHNKIAMRFELIGCTTATQTYYDISCIWCPAGSYCIGDGLANPCGVGNNNESSFGGYTACQSCPAGWTCSNGIASPCPELQYVNCTTGTCVCQPCDSGYVCKGGLRKLCRPGSWSDGLQKYCQSCLPGTYQPNYGRSSCWNCPTGQYSSVAMDHCSYCPDGTYTASSGGGCTVCDGTTSCPCTATPGPCYNGSTCHNLDPSSSPRYKCGDCPPGMTGDGSTCSDIDECATSDPCWNATRCVNTVPGYQCLACPSGYEGTYEDGLSSNVSVRIFKYGNKERATVNKQSCVDVDECSSAILNTCAENAVCTNTVGSFSCGPCSSGFIGNPYYECYPDNYCTSGRGDCSVNATCSYLRPGLYRCDCKPGYGGTGKVCGLDTDMDGFPDDHLSCPETHCLKDKCPKIPNSGQEDQDNDQVGDICDPDADNDGVFNTTDNCLYVSNLNQTDSDGDGVGDRCDNCASVANPDQKDSDEDGIGDACDTDDDNDGVADTSDNCRTVANPTQTDTDGDGVGDKCDNCPTTANADQADVDQNGFGDACDPVGGTNRDRDGDSVPNSLDNCAWIPNADQADTNGNGVGDACDPDADGDGVADVSDNCPFVANADQNDTNGDGVGNACYPDYDADGYNDEVDNCPSDRFRHNTTFTPATIVRPDGSSTGNETLEVTDHGRQIYMTGLQMDKVIAIIGPQRYGPMDFWGTFFVNVNDGNSAVGFIFGYQTNRRFYVVQCRRISYNLVRGTGGVRGCMLQLVNWASGPSSGLADALWKSADTSSGSNVVRVIWQDPFMTPWEPKTSYRWHLAWRPSIGQIQFQLYQGVSKIVDSGLVYDTSITGGRLGLFSFNQSHTIWSALEARCAERLNKALFFDGVDDYVTMANISYLGLTESFTLEVWIQPINITTARQPLMCTLNTSLCLGLENKQLFGQLNGYMVRGSTTLQEDYWTHVLMRYSAQELKLDLFINSTGTTPSADGTLSDVPAPDWAPVSDTVLYLGRDGANFYTGLMDELRIYSIALSNTELEQHLALASLVRANDGRYIRVHYSFDDNASTTELKDAGGVLNFTARITGARFVESWLDSGRFQVIYPTNRRKRRSVLFEEREEL